MMLQVISIENESGFTGYCGGYRKYITEIGKSGERILIILELDKLFSEEEHEELVTME